MLSRTTLRGVSRLLSTSSVARSAVVPTSNNASSLIEHTPLASSSTSEVSLHPYPFSTRTAAPIPPFDINENSLRKGKGLMEHLHKTVPNFEKQELLATLFAHNHPKSLRPGSVLRVTMEHAPTSFAGVMLAVKRRGIDTSFVLRNIVEGTGVEMQFFINSPHLKNIEVLRDHTGTRKGRRVRRAKLFYLRNQSDKMTAFASGVTD
ncbi:hypothetical protein HWV62_7842 [Athelia sp. TMB]|nr:hypothetical protein HWV62_32586 [Athelia sp. TMB]KAF7985213.1 hypothetical protein HWV62_7842 [Athelia sp. TMB]